MHQPAKTPTRPLGKSGVEVSAIGVGTSAWRHTLSRLGAYQAYIDGGVSFFDTAEVYFWGESERALAALRREDGRLVQTASKFAPVIGRASPRQMMRALDASLARLELDAVDLYYVHFPFPGAGLNGLTDGLTEAVKSGKARAVGVSNFSAAQMRRVADRLGRAGIPLAANEVNYSLLHRNPERNGVLDACRELDCALVAYFPLASGQLARVSGDGKKPKIEALQRVLAEIGQSHQATASQAALGWLLARDPRVIPIPGTSNDEHARDNAAALTWSLTQDEFQAIDAAAS